MTARSLPERFIEEKLSSHWKVDETEESFACLLHHLEVSSNFRRYFEQALEGFMKRLVSPPKSQDLNLLDLGCGVAWTSAILANKQEVRHVYAVEASQERLKHAQWVVRHFGVPLEKVTLQLGTFAEFQVPGRVDGIILCASFHHCYNDTVDLLFSNIQEILAPGGKILLANEHYVDFWFNLHRILSFLKHFFKQKKLFYSLSNLRAPYPFDGEHWRTKTDLTEIFHRNGLKADFFIHEGDLCKEEVSFIRKMGYHYYYAILERN